MGFAAAGRFLEGVTGASAEARFPMCTGGALEAGAHACDKLLLRVVLLLSLRLLLLFWLSLLLLLLSVVAVVDASLSHDLVAAVAGDAVAVLTVGVVADVAFAVALFSDAVVKLSLLSCVCSC